MNAPNLLENSVKSPVHTEDQLGQFLVELDYTNLEYCETLHVGTTGLVWSPDGNEIACHLICGNGSQVHGILAKSEIDGSESD